MFYAALSPAARSDAGMLYRSTALGATWSEMPLPEGLQEVYTLACGS